MGHLLLLFRLASRLYVRAVFFITYLALIAVFFTGRRGRLPDQYQEWEFDERMERPGTGYPFAKNHFRRVEDANLLLITGYIILTCRET